MQKYMFFSMCQKCLSLFFKSEQSWDGSFAKTHKTILEYIRSGLLRYEIIPGPFCSDL